MQTCWHGRSDFCPICALIVAGYQGPQNNKKGEEKHELESHRHRQIESSGVPIEAAERNIDRDN